jgi:S-adenosylmethionine:tRNA ribosyltransferase-isomerase
VRTADFRFELPPELIAQSPAPQRDQSRLLVLHRNERRMEHRRFQDLPEYLQPGDVLVLNDSRVIPARLHGVNAKSGGRFEMVLLEESALNQWWAMVRPGKRAHVGTRIMLLDHANQPTGITATVVGVNDEGHRQLEWAGTNNVFHELDRSPPQPLASTSPPNFWPKSVNAGWAPALSRCMSGPEHFFR